MSLLFIIYLYISIQRYKTKTRPSRANKLSTTYKRMSELEENAAIAAIPDPDRNRRSESDAEGSQHAPEAASVHEEIQVEPDSNGLQDPERRPFSACAAGQMPMIDYSGEGVNFFLRMGLIGKFIMNMIVITGVN